MSVRQSTGRNLLIYSPSAAGT